MVDSWLGKRIKKYMKNNRYSQTFVNEKTGIDLYKLNMSLNGNRRFTFIEYELICGVFGVNTDEFLKPRLPDQKGV